MVPLVHILRKQVKTIMTGELEFEDFGILCDLSKLAVSGKKMLRNKLGSWLWMSKMCFQLHLLNLFMELLKLGTRTQIPLL